MQYVSTNALILSNSTVTFLGDCTIRVYITLSSQLTTVGSLFYINAPVLIVLSLQMLVILMKVYMLYMVINSNKGCM